MKSRFKKRIFKISLWTLGIAVVLTIALAVHLAMVMPKTQVPENNRQLSRIDFKTNIDSANANKIRAMVANLPGVDATLFNIPDGILVYTYDPKKQNSETVFRQVLQLGDHGAQKYVVSAADMQSGCPAAVEKNAFTSTLSKYVQQLLN